MMRTIARKVAPALTAFAASTAYPTRTVEHAFAWITIVWSYSVIFYTPMINGDAYLPMLDLMPAWAWGWLGLVLGVVRVIALFTNGHWRPTPELRLAGAAWGMSFWGILYYCYYEAVNSGATDFPMRRAFLVFVFFEAYSCYRCGQDIGKRESIERRATSDLRSSENAEYG